MLVHVPSNVVGEEAVWVPPDAGLTICGRLRLLCGAVDPPPRCSRDCDYACARGLGVWNLVFAR